MKKLFFFMACVAMSVLAMGQDHQLVWANGRLLYGTPIESIDSLTYDEMEDVDTLHLLLPRTLIKVVHDTVYIHDTVYVETDCGGEDNPTDPSAGIGVFSVSADKQVTFSKGNLQYTQSTNTWSFAENQWDYIGTDNVTGGSVTSDPYDGNSKYGTALADKVDLFGWSTSATNFGVSTSIDNGDYWGTFIDWGTNRIGIDAPNTWRTLTQDEWEYMLNTRNNAEALVGIAQVNGVNGLIFLPDNWVCPEGITFKSGYHSSYGTEYYAAYQTFTAEQWSKLESVGAVFLPITGYRNGLLVEVVQFSGGYWSATDTYEAGARLLLCFSVEAHTHYYDNRSNGHPVRLIRDIEIETTEPETPGEGGEEPETPTNTENGHEYVDLGLSVKWATCNVGASKPEEYGDYFAWGEVEPKEVYDWSTYKWGNSNETQTKYCTDSNYGTVDNKTVLESADDAATANWGGAWRMPTYEELDELLTKCTWIVATMNGVDGCKVIGPNGNSIFLPSAGYRQGGSSGGREGTYWSSSLYAASNYASEINSRSDGTAGWNFGPRCYGNSIRPVCE